MGPIRDYYLLGFVALPEEVRKILTSDDMLIIPEMTMGMPIDIPKATPAPPAHTPSRAKFPTNLFDHLIISKPAHQLNRIFPY